MPLRPPPRLVPHPARVLALVLLLTTAAPVLAVAPAAGAQAPPPPTDEDLDLRDGPQGGRQEDGQAGARKETQEGTHEKPPRVPSGPPGPSVGIPPRSVDGEPPDNGRKPGRGAPPGPAGAHAGPPPAAGGPKPSAPAPSAAPATPDGGPAFVEAAAETGLDFVHFNGMSGELLFGEIMGSGAALFDYDGDGDLDVYLVQGDRFTADEGYEDATPPPRDRPPRDRLFRNLLVESGELRFRDVTGESGIDGRGYGMGVAVGDADGDGDPDLYVTNLGSNRLWLNRGDGTFLDATAPSRTDDPRWSTAATFLDHDGDGDLDLFVANYVAWNAAHPERCADAAGRRDYCGPLNYEPVADRLLENRGVEDGVPVFVNVSAPTTIRFAFGAALGVVAHDLAGDPRPEIYVANDASANQLWSAAGDGTWRDLGLERGAALDGRGRPEGSMGVDAGDYDGDGDLDLFLTHVRDETNTLYRNDGDGHFTDATGTAGLAAPSLGRTGFGTAFLDYDNDGRLDLLVVNGAVHRIPEQVEAEDPLPLRQPDQLFRNLGPAREDDPAGVRFADVSATAGEAFAVARVSRGAAFGDVDNDGDTDVLATDNAAPVRLLLNRVGERHHWLGLRLLRAGGGDDPGARVTLVLADGRRLLRRVRVDGSYLSAHDPRVLFGLGTATGAEAAVVRWSDGTEERFPLAGQPVDRYVTLTRGTAPGPPPPDGPAQRR